MTVIWYFSSTGNSLHTARSIAEKTGAGTPLPIRYGDMDIDLSDVDSVGFVFRFISTAFLQLWRISFPGSDSKVTRMFLQR